MNITADAFAARIAGQEECPHVAFPEVATSDWLPAVVVEAVGTLGMGLVHEGITEVTEDMIRLAEHVLIVAVAAGFAAGQSDAAQAFGSLSEIAWDDLPMLGMEAD